MGNDGDAAMMRQPRGQSGWALAVALGMLAISMALASWFFLCRKTTYFDDAFIYLHMAANIVEAGTARYFPITGSSMLLSSSPLRLLTLVPGLLALELAQVPLRTIEAARFAFLSSGFVSFLVFLPFWRNRLKAYVWVGVVLFLLGMSLDAVFLMEGGVLFLSLLSLAKLLAERSSNHFAVGLAVLLVGLSRPEFGAVAVVVTALVYHSQPRALGRILLGLAAGAAIYWIVMAALGVWPIPSTIWSKQVTGKLRLFSQENLIDVLPAQIAETLGSKQAWVGWLLLILPAAFSLMLRRAAIPVLIALGLLLAIAFSMPGNFPWYSQNFLLAWLVVMVAVAVELRRQRLDRAAFAMAGMALLALALTLMTNLGRNVDRAWNENSPMYLGYQEVGRSSIGDGKYVIQRYLDEPVRIRMCEIGIVSFYSGHDAWIFDICGLVQIGNLKDASNSWLSHFYPASFAESGEDQLARFKDDAKVRVIDVWSMSGQKDVERAKSKCGFVDYRLCINRYR